MSLWRQVWSIPRSGPTAACVLLRSGLVITCSCEGELLVTSLATGRLLRRTRGFQHNFMRVTRDSSFVLCTAPDETSVLVGSGRRLLQVSVVDGGSRLRELGEFPDPIEYVACCSTTLIVASDHWVCVIAWPTMADWRMICTSKNERFVHVPACYVLRMLDSCSTVQRKPCDACVNTYHENKRVLHMALSHGCECNDDVRTCGLLTDSALAAFATRSSSSLGRGHCLRT